MTDKKTNNYKQSATLQQVRTLESNLRDKSSELDHLRNLIEEKDQRIKDLQENLEDARDTIQVLKTRLEMLEDQQEKPRRRRATASR